MFILVHYIPAAGHFFQIFQIWSNAASTFINHFYFYSVFNLQDRTRQYFCIKYNIPALSSFIFVSLHFSVFLCISLQFSAFLTFIFFTGLIAKHVSQLGHGQSSMSENREAGFNGEDD